MDYIFPIIVQQVQSLYDACVEIECLAFSWLLDGFRTRKSQVLSFIEDVT